ncbi:MAG: 16S rRNA processing protein RimM [Clostridia bacterium]|nr:16S rRNA processing protein RimM [Clostridia bacterium]
MKRFLEAGRLNSPRGLKGELRFDCWCDSIAFLSGVKYLYLDDKGTRPLEIKELRESLSTVIFAGYEDRTRASTLTGRTVWFDREDIALPEGVYYNDDLIGLDIIDADTGRVVGKLAKIEEGAASDLYYIEGEKTCIVPAVKEFILGKDLQKGITVRFLEGTEA